MNTLRIYKDFDLPTKHLDEADHYVPPKARDDSEIDRRRALRQGTLLAEHQQKGLLVASTILNQIEEPEDIAFSSKILSATGLNTAWYSMARYAPVMRRRLKLPMLAQENRLFTPTSAELLGDSALGFEAAAFIAGRLVVSNEVNPKRVEARKIHLGRRVGNTSLRLACVGLGDQVVANIDEITDFDIQDIVRTRSLHALDTARTIGQDIGVPPSMAQLADQDSDLAVYWRRNSPNGAREAYDFATSTQLAA